MGLFKKLKKITARSFKIIKPLAKLAVKTAPIWTNFIPGGSMASNIIGRVAPLLDKAKGVRNKLRGMGATTSAISSRMGHFGGHQRSASAILGGPRFREMAQKSGQEESAFHLQGVSRAGIRGPVAQRFGPIHSHLSALRSGGISAPRRRTRRKPMRRGGRFVSRRRYRSRRRAA